MSDCPLGFVPMPSASWASHPMSIPNPMMARMSNVVLQGRGGARRVEG